MKCEHCGEESREGGRFCAGCGAPLPGAADLPLVPKTHVIDVDGEGGAAPELQVVRPAGTEWAGGAGTGRVLSRKKKKAKQFYPGLEPGKSRFFTKIYYLFTDSQLFFVRLDMEREFFTALVYLALVVAACFGLLRGALSMFLPAESMNYEVLLRMEALAVGFFLLLSVVGMVLMTGYYRRWVSWLRVFGVFAFSSLPLCVGMAALVMILAGGAVAFPGMIIFMYAFAAFISFGSTGLQNVLGLDSVPTFFWSAIITAATISISYSAVTYIRERFGVDAVAFITTLVESSNFL